MVAHSAGWATAMPARRGARTQFSTAPPLPVGNPGTRSRGNVRGTFPVTVEGSRLPGHITRSPWRTSQLLRESRKAVSGE